MSDQDPSAFLRSEKSAGSEAVLYDAKKWMWVPDETTGFIAGELKNQNGDQVTLELNNGNVSEFYSTKNAVTNSFVLF